MGGNGGLSYLQDILGGGGGGCPPKLKTVGGFCPTLPRLWPRSELRPLYYFPYIAMLRHLN